MILVLDTNVLISAFIGKGLCAELLEQALRRHRIAICDQILSEFREHLSERYRQDPGVVVNAVQWLRSVTQWVLAQPLTSRVCRDPDDDGILGAAVAAGAELLVTLDNDLLVLGEHQGIRILAPWELMRMDAFWDSSGK